MLLLTLCKQKLADYVLHNQRLNFLKKCDSNEFWSKMAQKSISEETFETLKTDYGVNNRLICTPKVSRPNNGAIIF